MRNSAYLLGLLIIFLTCLYYFRSCNPNLSTNDKVAPYEAVDRPIAILTAYETKREDEQLANLQCPIPLSDRRFNRTGSQCVHVTIESLGFWAEEPKLMKPPYGTRPDCQGVSGPGNEARILRSINVKFEQYYQDRKAGLSLIKKAMKEGRGCLFGVPGHAMLLLHYDEKTNVVKWVDNMDRNLRVQTMTVAEFNNVWDSWVLVIYADNDIVPNKIHRVIKNLIPIFDPLRPLFKFPLDFVPFN